ncbi:MAG: N-6 DNA methylase [Prevotella sp.]|nr:N-6 DNA methylase [Prevotella sp.]
MNIEEFIEKNPQSDVSIALLGIFKKAGFTETDYCYINIASSYDDETSVKLVKESIEEAQKPDRGVVCIVPQRLLENNKRSVKSIREKLIEDNILDTVLVVPKRWIDETANTDFAILFLNSKKKRCGNIKFVDITYDSGSDLEPDGIATYNLIFFDAYPDANNLFGDMYEDEIDLLSDYFSEFVCVAGNYEIKNNEYSLEPAKYTKNIKPCDGFVLMELWDIVDKKIDNAKGRIIHLADLKESVTHYELDVTAIPYSEEIGKFYSFEGRGIIVSKKEGKLKPTLVDTKGITIYVPLDEMEIIKEDNRNNWLLEYAVSELQKDYVKWQCEAWQNESLSCLRIRIPNNQENKSSIELQMESSIRSQYMEICTYCNRNDLVDLLKMIKDESIQREKTIAATIRNIIGGFILPKLVNLKIVSIELKPNKTNIREFSEALAKKKEVPIHIKRIFHDFSDIIQDANHPTEIQNLLDKGEVPYLNEMLIYELLNVLQWCMVKENDTFND